MKYTAKDPDSAMGRATDSKMWFCGGPKNSKPPKLYLVLCDSKEVCMTVCFDHLSGSISFLEGEEKFAEVKEQSTSDGSESLSFSYWVKDRGQLPELEGYARRTSKWYDADSPTLTLSFRI